LHWRFDPADVDALLPTGLTLDTYDGAAWVPLTPFGADGSRPPLMPPLRGLSNFVESNVRSYVIGPDGRDATRRLECDERTVTDHLSGSFRAGGIHRCDIAGVTGVAKRWIKRHVRKRDLQYPLTRTTDQGAQGAVAAIRRRDRRVLVDEERWWTIAVQQTRRARLHGDQEGDHAMEASAPRHRATDLVRVNCPRSPHAR
jgi:Uncharacterized conserved protein (COG2071)